MKLKRTAVLMMIFSLWLVACESAPEHLEATAQQSALASNSFDGATELKTNILKGVVRLTNENSFILNFLSENRWSAGPVRASSTQPQGYGASTSNVTVVNPSEFKFEMLVEAGAGGVNGVTYNVQAYHGPTSFPVYQGAVVKPSNIAGPTEVSIQQCLGSIQFVLGEDETCSKPVTATYLRFSTNLFSVYETQGKHAGFVSTAFNQEFTVYYTVSMSTGSFSNSKRVQVSVGCDEVVPVCIVPQKPPESPGGGGGGGPVAVGAVNGPWELIGQPTVSSWYPYIYGGTPYTSRSKTFRTAGAPVQFPSTWWELTDLPVGSGHVIRSGATLRSGREFTELLTQTIPTNTNVVANQTTTIARSMNGQTQYPFVMHPAFLHGAIRLAFPAEGPAARSSLESLFFAGDYDNDADGQPDLSLRDGSYLYASGTRGGYSQTSFPGRYDSRTKKLSSNYEQVLPSAYDEPNTWQQDGLHLRLWSQGIPLATKPGLYAPGEFRSGSLSVQPTVTSKLLQAGERFRIDHEYCFSELKLNYWTALGRFFNPRTQVRGSFAGVDWQNRPAAYAVTGDFLGEPAFVGYPPQLSQSHSFDKTQFALPQGTYTLSPSASMVNDNDQVNEANFAPFSLTVGCGQTNTYTFPFAISMISPSQQCAQSATPTVSGVVKSGGEEVDRMWYRLNDGPETDLCTNCGVDPVFSFAVQLQSCSNNIQVFAQSGWMPAPSSVSQALTWDDPVDGSSCAGSFCVNHPPVARCANAQMTCGAAAPSVNDGSYDPDPGDTVTCVQTPEGPYTQSSQQVTLTCTDSTGLSSSCAATVSCPDCIGIHLRDYNLFLLRDYTGGHDVLGKVAAGGNITMTNFAVGSRLPQSDTSRVLVSGGNLSLSNGGIWGDAWYGGTLASSTSVIFRRGVAAQGTPVDFSARGALLRELSSQLAGLMANGTTTVAPWGGIMLKGTRPDVNVFLVDASAFTNGRLFSIEAPAGSLAVVNIYGSAAIFRGFSNTLSGGIDPHGLLYNFVDASAITASGFGFRGTVLAPYAQINFSNGSFDGAIYARSLTGNAEGHLNALNDRDMCR